MNYPKPNKLRNFYTPKDVREHNTHDDCWISLFNKVYDLTKLLHENNGKCECDPIVLAAGTDVTHWFDPKTQAVSLLQTLIPYLYSLRPSLTRRLAPSNSCALLAVSCTCPQ
jgi:cytochrome b involved in lipid metabolism